MKSISVYPRLCVGVGRSRSVSGGGGLMLTEAIRVLGTAVAGQLVAMA